MTRRRFFILRGLELGAVLAALYFEPTYIVRGTLWGEAFFDGKPTSFWRSELNQWTMAPVRRFDRSGSFVYYARYSRRLTFVESVQARRWPFGDNRIRLTGPGPTVLYGDEDAAAVLGELLDDPSPEIRLSARIGLGVEPGFTRYKFSW